MRAFECSMTQVGRDAVLEILLAAGHPIRLRRIKNVHGVEEKWRVGFSFLSEWCVLRKGANGYWNATFGGNFKLPVLLEGAFAEVVGKGEGCWWIWPHDGAKK